MKRDGTEEVGTTCKALVLPLWMSCTHSRRPSIRCDEPHFKEQVGWVATTKVETSSLGAGRTQSMPRAKQCLFQPDNAFKNCPKKASCACLLMTIHQPTKSPANPTGMGWAGMQLLQIYNPNPFVILENTLLLTNFNSG